MLKNVFLLGLYIARVDNNKKLIFYVRLNILYDRVNNISYFSIST